MTPTNIQATIPPDLGKVPITRLPVIPVVVHSKSQEDYEPNLQLEVDDGSALVIGVGFMMEKAVESVAKKNPNARFLLIDSPLLDSHNAPYTLPNVSTITFREQEGSFLAGVVAGMLTTGKIGFVGGMELPLIKKFEAGFRAGVRTVNPTAQVLVTYTGSFDNPGAGKQAAQDLISKGADILFHAAGSDGSGAISAVKDAKASGKTVWVIGCDSDQQHLAPEVMLTSMVKHVDLAVWETIQRALDHTLRGGDEQWGLKEAGVGLAPLRSDAPKKDAVLAAIQGYSKLIIAGQLHVPATLDELATFTLPPGPIPSAPAPAAPSPSTTAAAPPTPTK